MANKIATLRWNDINDQEYIFDIYSKATSITTLLFDSVYSATDSYKTEEGDYMGFVYSYIFEITFGINDSTEENLLSLIIAAPENDIYGHLRTLTDTIFIGYMMPELIERENAPYPYSLKLSFTDGIGKLKNQKYTLIDNTTYYRIPILKLFQIALQEASVDDLYSSTDTHIITRPGYYPSQTLQTTQYNEPFTATMVNWLYLTNNGSINIYDTLKELCRLTHSRFYYYGGIYYLENIDIRKNTTFTQYAYSDFTHDPGLYPGTESTASNEKITIDHSNLKILAGSTINYLPGIKSDKLKIKFRDLNNRISILSTFLWDSNHLTSLTEITDIEKKDDTKLNFEFDFNYDFDINDAFQMMTRIKMKFTIKVGSYYLSRDIDSFSLNNGVVYKDMEWKTTLSYFYIYSEGIFLKTTGAKHIIKNYIYLINTPEIPESGTLSLNLEYIGVVDASNTLSTPTEIDSVSIQNTFNYMDITGEDDDTTNEITYTVVSSEDNNKQIEFEGVLCDFTGSTLARLQVRDGTNTNVDTSLWHIDGDANEYLIQELFLKSVMEFRKSIRSIHNINLFQKNTSYYPYPVHLIDYDNSDFIILNADRNYRSGDVGLRMMQFEKGAISFTFSSDSNKGVQVSTTGVIDILNAKKISTFDDGSEPVDPVKKYKIETVSDMRIAAFDHVNINGLVGNYYEHDYFDIMMPNDSSLYDTWRLTQQAKEGDTVLWCNGVISREYPQGSLIIFKPRPGIRVQVIDGTATTEVTITVATLPDPSALSIEELRRRINVKNQGVDMKVVLQADLTNYNDVAIDFANNKLLFSTSQANNFIVAKFEEWITY